MYVLHILGFALKESDEMMKKRNIIATIACLMIVIPQVVMATDHLGGVTIGDVHEFDGVSSNVLGIVQFFGYAMAIGMILYLGIKYMMAPANEKADVKNASIKYVIGAILLAGGSGLLGIIQTFSRNIAS